MASDENVARLMEMGFTETQAQEALKHSSNNLEASLSYLFNDAPESAMDDIISASYDAQDVGPSGNPFVENIKTQVDQTDSSVSDFQTSFRHDNDKMVSLDPHSGRAPDRADADDANPFGSSDIELPELPHRPAAGDDGSKSIENYLDDDLRDTLASYVPGGRGAERGGERGTDAGSAAGSAAEHPVLDYNIFADLYKHLRPAFLPPILVPGMRSMLEAYFAPILMILHEVTPFRNAVVHHDFGDYGFTDDWFKGKKSDTGAAVVSRLVRETQKLVGFLDGDSDRFFASIRNLTDALPRSLLDELARIESIDELLSCLYGTYVAELRLANADQQADASADAHALGTLFHSKFRVPEQPEFDAACFLIEFGHIRSEMYHSLHNVIIGEKAERIDSIDIPQFSDVITIPVLAPEEVYNFSTSQGLSIPEIFYPQTYSKSHSNVYKDLRDELGALNDRRQAVVRQRQSLTSFRGQKVDDALRVSLQALRVQLADAKADSAAGAKADSAATQDPEMVPETDQTSGENLQASSGEKVAALEAAIADLERFSGDFQRRGEELRNEWLEINDKIDSFNLTEQINSRMSAVAEPYMLIGAILDSSNFFYLTKNRSAEAAGEKQWICVRYAENDFHLVASSFDEVHDKVVAITSDASKFSVAIILVYAKVSCWNDAENAAELPDSLKQFLAADRAHLYESIKYLETESLISVSNEEEDEVDEYQDEEKLIDIDDSSEPASPGADSGAEPAEPTEIDRINPGPAV